MYYAKKIILLGMFSAMFLFLTVPAVMAFSDEPCTGVNYECPTCTNCVAPPSSPPTEAEPYTDTDPGSGWTVSLWIEARDGSVGLWNWHYSASMNNSVSGLKKIDWGYPNCCTTPVTYVSPGTNSGGLSSPGNLKVFDAGVGAPSGWAGSISIIKVVQASPDNSSEFILVTNTDKMTMGPLNLELAKGDFALTFPLPACASAAPPAFAGDRNSSSLECREVINDCLDLDKDPNTPCTNTKLSVLIPKENGVINLQGVTWHPYTTDCGQTCEEGLNNQQINDCQNGLIPNGSAPSNTSILASANPNANVTVAEAPYYCSGLGDERQSECIRVEIGSLYSCTQSGGYASCVNLCPYYAYYGYVPPGCP